MTYTGAQKTTQTRQAVFMGHRTQARRKAHYKRIRAAIRTATGRQTATGHGGNVYQINRGGRGGFVQSEGRFICRFAVYHFLRPFPAFLTFPHIPT